MGSASKTAFSVAVFLLLLFSVSALDGAVAQDRDPTHVSGEVDTPDPESVSPKTVRTPVEAPKDWSPAAVFSWPESKASSRLRKQSLQQDELGNRGTEFWVLFQRNYDDNYNRGEDAGIYIDVSSEFSTSGTLEISGIDFSRDFTVEPGSVTRIQLPDTTISTVTASVLTDGQSVQKGIHITAADPIAVYGLDTFTESSDGYLGLPTSILSTSYLVPSYTTSGFGSVLESSQMAVVSPRDGNTVTITPSAPTRSGRDAGVSFEVTLDEGEAYQIRANGVNDDLTGTVIQSSLPVSVFSGSACTNVPSDFPACDHLIEHIPPTETWGSQFVVAPVAGREAGDTFRILAGEDGTEVAINGQTVTTLGFGDYYETILDSSAVIETSNPALVTQYMNGQEYYEVDSGDPFMMMIPPTDQFGFQYAFSTPSEGFARNFVSLTPPGDATGSVQLDGSALGTDFFDPVPNSNFAVGSDSIPLGTHTASSATDARFGLYSYGDNPFDSYGFTGGLLLEFITEAGGPDLSRTDGTIALSQSGQAEGEPLVIAALITKEEDPPVESATLFHRLEGESEYTASEMTNVSGDQWEAEIPGESVQGPGVEYYLLASDGRLQSTTPSLEPESQPYSIAVLPNEPPSIEHAPVLSTPPGEALTLEADVTDNTDRVSAVELLYRSAGGNPAYTALDMQEEGGGYSATIPGEEVTEQGLEYYLRATDNFGVSATEATADQPISVVVGVPPAAPSGLETTVVGGQVELSWDANTEADLAGYTVYRAPTFFEDVSGATALNSSLVMETAYTDSEVTSDQTYYYRVTATDEAGLESEPSNADSAQVSARRPTAETEAVTDVTVSSARFHGQVDPNGAQTSVGFEFHPTSQPGDVRTVEAVESPLTGFDGQPVSARVEDLQSETEYSVRVVANSQEGTAQGAETSFTTPPLNVTLEQSPQPAERGGEVTVSVTVSEGFAPTEEARLYFRRVGVRSFQSTVLEGVSATTYEAAVPGTAVTERGVEYYVRLSNGDVTATVPESDPVSQPRYAPVRVAELEAGVALEAGQYRMMSAPLRLDTTDAFAQLRDDFGQLDRRAWRLLRWNSEAGEYDEVTTEGGSGDLVPGRAYWLITRDGETVDGQATFDVGAGRSVPAEPIQLALPPGWTQVGNPRPYPIAWSAVSGRESVMDPVAYDPSASDSVDFNVELLRPWTGYWVYNPGPSTVQIEVPSPEAEGGQTSPTVAADPSVGEETLFDEELDYAVALTARLDREGKAPLRDVHTEMGVADAGQPGVGPEDVADPPPIGDHLRLSIVEDDRRLAGSLRSAGEDGYTWDLELSTSVSRERKRNVRVRLQTLGTLPPEAEHRLMDRDTGRRILTEEGISTVQLTEEHSTRSLRLIVGSEEFAEAESEALRPDRTGLRAVYPNPSRGPVSVDYQLKTAEHVRISVYDVLGRRVQTLVDERRPAGHHTVQWSGQTGGRAFASGAYLVRIETPSTSSSQRISIVR